MPSHFSAGISRGNHYAIKTLRRRVAAGPWVWKEVAIAIETDAASYADLAPADANRPRRSLVVASVNWE
jgi:hypothetical protein